MRRSVGTGKALDGEFMIRRQKLNRVLCHPHVSPRIKYMHMRYELALVI